MPFINHKVNCMEIPAVLAAFTGAREEILPARSC